MCTDAQLPQGILENVLLSTGVSDPDVAGAESEFCMTQVPFTRQGKDLRHVP